MTTRRLYYDDSFAREFDARVVSCEAALHTGKPAWEAILDCTVFYPTSGGQPHDVGKLGDANVVDVRDEEDEIVHVVDREVRVGSVHGCIDWARRFDHMQQHTGQHLLSAMFQERFGRSTVSFHLGAETCTIDLRGEEPSEDILEGAERAANRVIAEDRPVTVRYGTAAQLAELGVRKDVERAGILRAIEIEGADLQPCGGTHVQRTAQIGLILVRRCSKIRQDWRIEFVCGGRAERTARRDFLLLRRVAEHLNCAPVDVVTAAERAVSERDAHFKNTRAAWERLGQAEASLAWQASLASSDGTRLIERVFGEDTPQEYLVFFATQLATREQTIVLLARLPCGQVVFAQHPSAGKDMNQLLKEVFQQFAGKGGGTRDFARGRLNDSAQASAALALAREMMSKP
jgi:alanyl-tRNA synthetase